VRRVLGVAATCALLAIAGCGGSESSSPDETSDEPVVTEEVAETEAPSLAESKSFVEDFIPEVKTNIKKIGADLLGTPSVQCAATGGPETECVLEIPFRRLDECAVASTNVMVVNGEDGIEATDDSGEIESEGQICYIGPDGESVPELP
jgi:hypothetical protein